MVWQVNRAKQLWENWENQEKQIESLAGLADDRRSMKYKYGFLSNGLFRLSINATENEKLFMQAISTVAARLQKQLYPNPLIRMLHRFKVFIIDKPAHLDLFRQNVSENLQILSRQLKLSGLHHIVANLQNKLDYESPTIELKSFSGINNNGKLELNIRLEKSDVGSYEFKGYDLAIINLEGEKISYTFSAESKITLNEAVNLMQGRPVFKSYENADGSISKRWIQLNLQQEIGESLQLLIYAPNYEYDIKKVLLENGTQLDFYAIAREEVRRGLEAGNRVEFQINGKGGYSITADPSAGKVNFFDPDKKPLSIASLKEIIHPVEQTKNKEINIIQQKNVQQDNQLNIIR